MGRPDGELSVLITDDAQIAEINAQYLDRTGPTNVISFSMIEGDFSDVNPGQVLGDVIVSIETAHREAADAGMATQERFAELLIHGILHIFGYDHETPEADAEQMTEKGDALMAMLREQDLIAR
ncbi:MAG: rRNA maturation RNase YbeY [Thermodesulfobacteriota bacterium]